MKLTEKIKNGKAWKWLKEKAPDVLETVGDLTGLEILENAGRLLKGKQDITPEMIQEFNRLKELDLQELELILEDSANARKMQTAALAQEDLFSKRFVYYFAFLIFILASVVVVLLFFVEIPERNERLIDVAFGAVVGAALMQVIQFFYGSSRGSKEKQDAIKQITNRLK